MWLLKSEKKVWNEIAAVLIDAGLLSLADFDALAFYARAKVAYLRTSRKARTCPVSISEKSGYESVSPWVVMARQHLQELIKLGASLGMNPSARTRIEVAPKPAKTDGLIQ